MTFNSQIRRVDSQLDRLQLAPTKSAVSSPTVDAADADPRKDDQTEPTARILELQTLIKSLSASSSSNPLLSSWRISKILDEAGLSSEEVDAQSDKPSYETELEWLLISKATLQTYGLILNALLEQTIPLSEDIWYWDEILGSYAYSGLYTIQTSPWRFWHWSTDIFQESRTRFADLRRRPREAVSASEISDSLTAQWKQFYGLVQDSIRDRSVADMRRKFLSPVAACRAEARKKQRGLKRLREMGASGLGLLMDEGLNFAFDEELEGQAKARSHDASDWKLVVARNVALLDKVLQNATTLETGVRDFEEACINGAADDPEISIRNHGNNQPAIISKRIHHILKVQLPIHAVSSQKLAASFGRPSRLVRYWLPAIVLGLSSSTILRIAVNRKAAILEWVEDFGSTARDFWLNWIVEPTKKVIGTIRHDKDSEVAIMSKQSLKGDRDSLERMVVDFAIDKPQISTGNSSLSEAQIADIRAKVKEGDLTPVLRAYEKDLRSPLMGSIRGDLIRTLLIQVQKTKVDVEVAINGIDALLKSQELVFGFLGLTPGIIVCIGAFRYLGGVFGNRATITKGRKAGQTIRVLRNIDRILTIAAPTENGILSCKDYGLLLCEVHVLRSRAARLFPGEIEREFLEDVNELVDIRIGIDRQLKVVQRIRWAYAKWLSN